MKRRFYLAIVFFLVWFAVCEAALFVVSPAIQSTFRFLGTLPGFALLAAIFVTMSVGCLIGIVLTRMDMRFDQEKKSADP
jgi:ABC-type nickel/cobalt efflux system permease component RcnA